MWSCLCWTSYPQTHWPVCCLLVVPQMQHVCRVIFCLRMARPFHHQARMWTRSQPPEPRSNWHLLIPLPCVKFLLSSLSSELLPWCGLSSLQVTSDQSSWPVSPSDPISILRPVISPEPWFASVTILTITFKTCSVVLFFVSFYFSPY